jgi:cytochrome P450
MSFGSGHFDMISEFSNPLRAIVAADLLGTPIQDDAQLHAWVLDLAEVLGNCQPHPIAWLRSSRASKT